VAKSSVALINGRRSPRETVPTNKRFSFTQIDGWLRLAIEINCPEQPRDNRPLSRGHAVISIMAIQFEDSQG